MRTGQNKKTKEQLGFLGIIHGGHRQMLERLPDTE